jgi:hypothetical protein
MDQNRKTIDQLAGKLVGALGIDRWNHEYTAILGVVDELVHGAVSKANAEQTELLKQLIASVDRTNELLSIIARLSGAVIATEPSPIPFESLSK